MNKIYDGKIQGKLGTEKNPATMSVQSEKRQKELASTCKQNGWACDISVNPDSPEDTAQLDILQNPILPTKVEPKVGRNDPCVCGSKKKYKKCCGTK